MAIARNSVKNFGTMDKMIEMVRITNFDQIDKNKKGKNILTNLANGNENPAV